MAASPICTHPEHMGEGVSETKDDRNERIYDEKGAACSDDTTPDDMEVGVGGEKDDKNDRLDDEIEAEGPDEETSEGENTDSV